MEWLGVSVFIAALFSNPCVQTLRCSVKKTDAHRAEFVWLDVARVDAHAASINVIDPFPMCDAATDIAPDEPQRLSAP